MNQYKAREKEDLRYREYEEEQEAYTSADGVCAFCGSPMEEEDNFCPECGGPRAGITCPKCGTLNHGSFCSHCNSPLDDLAQKAVRDAIDDPRFQEAQSLAEELKELEEEISRLKKEAASNGSPKSGNGLDTSPILSDKIKNALERYNTLFADVANIKVKEPSAASNSPSPEKSDMPTSQPQQFSIKTVSLKEAVEKYKAVAAKLQAKLDAMLPDAGATPQEQRNFFSARKIVSAKVTEGDRFWICNYCHCKHRQPSECTKPWMGGKWIVEMKVDGIQETTLFD